VVGRIDDGPIPSHDTANPDRLFYGWTIVGLTFGAQFLAMGTYFYTFGVFLKPLSETFGTDRSSVAIALSLQQFVVAMLGPWVGKRLAGGSIRTLMLWGTLLLSLGGAVLSRAESIVQLYFAYGLIVGAGIALAGPLPNTALLANWFVRRRGTALGISQFGVTVSGTVMVPFATWLIASYGWRAAMLALAALPIALLAPAVRWLVVDRPEDRGLLPDGDTHLLPGEDSDPSDSWTMGRAIRDRRVLLLALAVGLNFTAMSAVLQILHSHITDSGLSGADAASVVAAATFAGAVAKPLFGALADHFDPRAVMGLSTALQAVGVWILIDAASLPLLLTSGAIFGLGYGGVLPLWGVLLGALFGRHSFGHVMGLMGPIMLPFQVFGFPFATFVFDRHGSYTPALYVFLGCYAAAAAVLFVMPVPRRNGQAA